MEEQGEMIIQMAAPSRETLAQRGQFITHMLMIDELLDDITEWRETPLEEGRVTPEILTYADFYAWFTGCMEVNPDYRDGALMVAMFGVEAAVSGFLDRYPPNTEDYVQWMEDVPLPEKLTNGEFDLGKVLRRDNAKDKAVVHAVMRGTNVQPPNLTRMQSLLELGAAVSEVAEERSYRHLTLLAGLTVWHMGQNIDAGLEMLESMSEFLEPHQDTGSLIAKMYRETQPEGPVWLRIQADRERDAYQ